ncbi:MAG: nuclear transport factor 2 family protein [Chloroflexi bacterium]|nr:nuclear transport factor 2 family protein [Chloroflexota bacterium]
MSDDLGHELDRLAIMDLLIRYARSVDSHDFAAMRSCFADDLVFLNIGSPDAQHGGDTYTDVIRRLLVPFGATQHLLGNQVVEFNGDVAHVETDLQATHFLAGDPDTITTLWASYIDEMARVGDGHEWVITHRDLRTRGSQRTTNAA